MKTIFVSTKRALIANKKVTWALALKGGATIARGKDDDIKCGKWRIGSKKLRSAIRAISAIRRRTIKRKANKRGKHVRSLTGYTQSYTYDHKIRDSTNMNSCYLSFDCM